MAGLFANLRLLALARRCARALERSAIAAETVADIAVRREKDEQCRLLVKPRRVELGQMDVAAIDERWRKQQEADAVGVDLEDAERTSHA